MDAPRVAGTLLLAAALLVSGCGSLGYAGSPSKAAVRADSAGLTVAREAAGVLPFTLGRGGYEDSVTAEITDFDFPSAGPGIADPDVGPRRFLIYSGRLGVAVASIAESLRAARKVAEDLGGYFQSLKGDVITIRVPAGRFEEALAAVSSLGRVLSRQIEAADVTEEVVDLELRLRNARALSQRLAELLGQAKTVSETLEVERELDRIRTEIERIEGRLTLLRDRIAYSTLEVAFVAAAEAPARPQSLPFPWLRELSIENLLDLAGGAR